MLASVSRFAALLTIVTFAQTTLAFIEDSPSFVANLAKRDGNPVAMKRSSVNLIPRQPSRSDQLKRMLSDALVALHVASASPSAHTSTSAPASTSTTSSHPVPSASASNAASRARMARSLESVKRAIADEPWETLDSSLLCPNGDTACPIFPRMGSYECVDTVSDLESCGGCASRSEGENCSTIPGAQGVACSLGRCSVFTCQNGWRLEHDVNGRDRCRKQRKSTVQL